MKDTIKTLYNRYVRYRTPRMWVTTQDIAIKSGRRLDRSTEVPDEMELRYGIRQVVSEGDTVVIIGGGYGSSSVQASRSAGESGKVITYEPVSELCYLIKQAYYHNYTEAKVEVRNTAIGEVSNHSIERYGEPDGDMVSPWELPAADVYVLDCEGAEDSILPIVDNRDSGVVIELHEWSKTSESDLKEAGYRWVAKESDSVSIWVKE